MSDYQGKRFKASQIPDPSKPGAARAAQQGRTSSPQQQRASRPVTPATIRPIPMMMSRMGIMERRFLRGGSVQSDGAACDEDRGGFLAVL